MAEILDDVGAVRTQVMPLIQELRHHPQRGGAVLRRYRPDHGPQQLLRHGPE